MRSGIKVSTKVRNIIGVVSFFSNDGHNHGQSQRQKQRGYGRDGRGEGYEAEVVHNRILNMVDPARHVHPGIPYDFFAGYLLMLADNLNPHSDNHVTLLGELPYEVESELHR